MHKGPVGRQSRFSRSTHLCTNDQRETENEGTTCAANVRTHVRNYIALSGGGRVWGIRMDGSPTGLFLRGSTSLLHPL